MTSTGAGRAMFEDRPDLMTIKNVSEITGLSPQYLRQLARQGRIPAVRIGERRWYIPKIHFIEWLEKGGDDAG